MPTTWSSPSSSPRELVAILRKFKYDCEYEETKNLGHAPSPDIVEELYQKMRARTRDLYPQRSRRSNPTAPTRCSTGPTGCRCTRPSRPAKTSAC